MNMPLNDQSNAPQLSPELPTTNVNYPWRTEPEIDAERQQFLAGCLATIPDIKQGIYPFKNIKLTRADVEWLLATHENGRGPVDLSDEQQRERLGLDLRGADLRQVDLRNLPLARLYGGLTRNEWQLTTLDQRDMAGVHLERADLSGTHLERAILRGAHLEGATLRGAYLQEAILFRAYLKDAYLRKAHLEDASLKDAYLEGAYIPEACLQGVDLRGAYFDSATFLEDTKLNDEKFGCASLVDVHWGDVNLSVVDWKQVTVLGDEAKSHKQVTSWGEVKTKWKRQEEYQAAVRANRQLANAMRTQGMNEEAIPFAYRAQILQRKVFWRQVLWGQVRSSEKDIPQRGLRQSARDIWRRIRSFAAYIFSWFLDILAGYGYKPGRSLLIYILMIAGFAICYYLIGHLSPSEALIFSVTSFHGRGFLPGPFALGNPVTGLAAVEAVVGLFIEISFIATFTQRFFGR
jgi:uncharacterized protein YjbI with pentapeptide repeats